MRAHTRTRTRTYTGALTVFWQEQRRMLRAKKGTRWNPQVSSRNRGTIIIKFNSYYNLRIVLLRM